MEPNLGLVLGIKPFSNANGDTKGLKFVSLVPKPLPREEEKGLLRAVKDWVLVF